MLIHSFMPTCFKT